MAVDWSVGRYETIAKQLLPAAATLVDHVHLTRGERVVDIGCGTGNASLLAARKGARVTGVDPARRLLDVARSRAAAEGLEVTFVEGEAAAIPVRDGEIDAVISSFGVIFSPDPVAAAAEMARLAGPGGRVVLSAWLPDGPVMECVRGMQEAVARAMGGGARPPAFDWHDPEALTGLLGRHGFAVTTHCEELVFEAPSARDWLESQLSDHPLSVTGRAALQREGSAEAIYARALAVLEKGNEASEGFRSTGRYVVAIARRTRS